MENELVRVLGLKIELSEGFGREICQVTRDDNAGAAVDRGGQYMVVGVRQAKVGNQVLVPCPGELLNWAKIRCFFGF